MLINSEDAVRMLRDDWAGPYGTKQLSEELYAIMTANSPASSNAPATFSTDGTTAPVTIQVPTLTGDFPAISFTGPQGQAIGSVTVVDGTPTLMNVAGQPTTRVVATSGGGAGFGTIASGSGAGPYVVNFAAGEGLNGVTSVSAFPSQAGSNTIPAGVTVLVFQVADHTYFFMAPVWL